MVMVQSLHNATVVMTRRAEPASQNLRQHAQHLGESLLNRKIAVLEYLQSSNICDLGKAHLALLQVTT